MGTLHHGRDLGIDIDDETLAHLQAVVVAKLRRHEPFLLTVTSETGRESLWIHSASDVRFRHDAVEGPALDRARLERMVLETNRPTGLTIAAAAAAAVEQPQAQAPARTQQRTRARRVAVAA